jgi:Family of unknown function (DUF6114)
MPDDAGSAPEANAGPPSAAMEPAAPGPILSETPNPTSQDTPGRHSRTRPWSLPHRPQRPNSGYAQKHGAWRAWRHSRPFWGGLLLIIGGIELIAIPLSGVLLKGAVKLAIYIGIGGVFGVLIGALLIAAGLVLWINPTHRVFYGIAGIVLGILSFPASNLGGFFIGMLLAIIGGALGFAWAPAEPAFASVPPPGGYDDQDGESAPDRPADQARPAGLDLFYDPADTRSDLAGPDRSGQRRGTSGHRMLAVAAMPAVLVAGMLSTSTAAKAVSSPQQSSSCILLILCTPGGGSSPSSTPTPTPSANPTSPTSPTPTSVPLPLPSVSVPPLPGQPSPSPSATSTGSGKSSGGKTAKSKTAKAKKAKQKDAPSGLVASSGTSVLTAGTVTLDDFNFVANTALPVSGGGTEEAMEFTASSADLTGGVKVSVTPPGGGTSTTSSPSLSFTDNLTLYATELCGSIEGLTGQVCFTPSTVDAVLLKIAGVAGAILGSITMTQVTTDQPIASAGALQTGALTVTS